MRALWIVLVLSGVPAQDADEQHHHDDEQTPPPTSGHDYQERRDLTTENTEATETNREEET